jgi:hypothetical protein
VISAIDRLIRDDSATNTVALGVVWGFSLLVKPVLIYLVVPLMLVLGWIRLRLVGRCLAAFALALLVVSPWTVRNFGVTHRVIPVATGAWEIFLKGDTFARLVTQAEGIEELEADAAASLETLDRRLGIESLPLYEREPYYQRQAVGDVRNHPLGFARKVGVQGVTFWILGGDRRKTFLFTVLQLPVLVLFALAVRDRVRLDPGSLTGVCLVGAYFWAVYAVSLALCRYSMPLRPWLVVAVVTFLAGALGRKGGMRWKHA